MQWFFCHLKEGANILAKVLTTCPFCGCGCGLVLEVEKDQVHASAPQRAHPVSRGTLCIKGWNGHQIVHHEGRLKQPLIKQNGSLKPASWDRAIRMVADRFGDIMAQNGPDAIGVVGSLHCTNEENYLLNKFARTVLRTNHIDTAARFFQAPALMAMTKIFGSLRATASLLDVEKTAAILIFGANLKSQMANAGSFVLQAVKKGTPCVLVDPRALDHSPFMTLNLKLFPGTDLTLIYTLINVILKKDWQEPGLGNLEELKKSVQDYTLELCEAVTSIPANQIVETARLFATAKSGMILFGSGLTQQPDGTANVKALAALAFLTGNLQKEGAGILPLMYTNNMQGALDMGLCPEFLPGYQDVVARNIKDWQQHWPGLPPLKKGLTLQEMLNQAGKTVRAMYIVGENLARSAPDSINAVKALKRLNFLVVQEMFRTETAELADVVLPAVSFAEKEGTFTNTEGRVQRLRRAISPMRNALPDCEIVSKIAARMGKQLSFHHPEEIFKEIAALVPGYQGMTYQALDRPGGLLTLIDSLTRAEPRRLSRRLFEQALAQPLQSSESPTPELPFTMVVCRSPFHIMTGTQIEKSFILKKELAVGTAEINGDQARELGLRHGWQVRISNAHGAITRSLIFSRDVPKNVIFVPVHPQNGLTLSLTLAKLEKSSKIPLMKMCAVKVETLK